MAKLMKAWRLYGFNDMRLDEVKIPEVKPGWVLFKVRVVQPSITEVLNVRDADTVGQESLRKILKKGVPQQLLGHELSGDVVETGEGVSSVKVGDRIAARVVLPCLKCDLCKSGKIDQCRRGPHVGKELPGCFAEYAVLPESAMIKLEDNISYNEGALIQTLHACTEVTEIARIELGDTVVVMGIGCMGSFTLQLAKVAGAGKIIAVDVRDKALDLAKEFGANLTVNSNREDPVQRVLDYTNGLGADIVFECAGGKEEEGLAGTWTLHQAIDMVRTGGKIVGASIIGDSEPLDLVKYRTKGVSLLFPCNTSMKLANYAVSLVASGRVKISPLITHVLNGLENLPKAMEITANKEKFGSTSPAQIEV